MSVFVVCPAFNEEHSVGRVVNEIRSSVPDAQVLVVDDGSHDATGSVARRAGARVLTLPFNVGVGGALRVGLLLAAREGASAVVQCDSDGQHPAKSIGSLVAALSHSDIVIGSRFAGDRDYQMVGPRRWASKLLGWAMSRVHNSELDDVTSGFRAFGPNAIRVLSVELPPEYLADTIDALVIAKSHGLIVSQLAVEMSPRLAGVPSHGPLKSGVYLGRSVLVLVLSLAQLVGQRIWRSS